jgi:hypothetical protein
MIRFFAYTGVAFWALIAVCALSIFLAWIGDEDDNGR